MAHQEQLFDVAVIGGGPAGLSAGVALARALRSVVVVDAGEQRNLKAQGVHGFLSREGMRPEDLVAAGQEELARYGGVARRGFVVSAARTGVLELPGLNGPPGTPALSWRGPEGLQRH